LVIKIALALKDKEELSLIRDFEEFPLYFQVLIYENL
jgi:hypothetical protein